MNQLRDKELYSIVTENQIKGFCLEGLISALFSANNWFVENNVIALKTPDPIPRYEVDVWASKILPQYKEEWKFASCKNVKESKHLKSASEEIHSHIYMNYRDRLNGRVSIRGYLAFAKETVRDDSIFKNLKVVSPLTLDIENMICGFVRFDELVPKKPFVLLYLLFLAIVKYIAQNSYTLHKLRQTGCAEHELVSLARHKYNIKKSLTWELDTKLRFYELFRWYQSDPQLAHKVTCAIAERQNCTREAAKNDFNVQFAYYLQIQNKMLSIVSAIRNALSVAYTPTQFSTRSANQLAKRVVKWKLKILQDSSLLSSIIPQFQFFFNVLGGTIFDSEFDDGILKWGLGLDIQYLYRSIEYFEELFPLKKGNKWFLSYKNGKDPGKFYMLRPVFMKNYAFFSRYYLCISEGVEPKEYYEPGCVYIAKLVRQIDREWKIFDRFSLYKDKVFLNLIDKFGN